MNFDLLIGKVIMKMSFNVNGIFIIKSQVSQTVEGEGGREGLKHEYFV